MTLTKRDKMAVTVCHIIPLVFLQGCSLLGEGGGDVARGVAAGAGELVAQVPYILDSAATGGWTAALLATGLAVWKGVSTGLRASKTRRVKEISEGVKKATK